MSKNITIAEGTQAKNFNNVHKLRTNLIGGGTQYWVPEDEAGAYAKLSEKTITANGTYNASDDSKDGFSRVNVNVSPNVTTKQISSNGTYYARNDGADGYSSVSVNVSGEGENTAVFDKPIGGDSNEHYIEIQSGNPIDTILPTSIRIITNPTKTSYKDRQSIDIEGIVVKAYKRDGTLWESADYPGGVIPISELIINPKIVDFNLGDFIKTNHNGINVCELTYSWSACQSFATWETAKYVNLPTASAYLGNHYGYGSIETVGSQHSGDIGARFYLTRYNDAFYAYGLNKSCGLEYRYLQTYYHGTGEDRESLVLWARPYMSNESVPVGRWTYLETLSTISNVRESVQHGGMGNVPISTVNPLEATTGNLEWGGETITVKWKRPKDSKALKTSFPITYDVTV